MGQSKRASLFESGFSTILGLGISNLLYMVILPLYDHEPSWVEAITVNLIFCTASFLR